RPQLLTMSIAAGVCVANIYFNQPILKDIAASLHASEGQVGNIAVLAQAGYGLGLFFITPLGDKVNRKKLILVLQLALLASLIGMTLINSLQGIFIMNLLIGLFCVAAQVILPMVAGMDPVNRGKNVGIVFTGILVGILAARVFSGYIASWLGWRYVYGISAGLLFITMLLVQFSLPAIRQSFQGNYLNLLKSTLAQFVRFPLLRRTALLGAFVFGAFCSFWTTLTFHLSKAPFNYHANTIGLFGILAIGGALVAPVFGKRADKGSAMRSQLFAVSMLIVSILFIKIFPYSLISLIIAVLLLDIGVQATQVTNIATIYTLDAAAHSRINTVYMTIYFIGGSLGTLVGVQCWKLGGWNLVTWQLLTWAILALVIVLNGYSIYKKQTLKTSI
ncbi:MAG: MFS transporter, partial [Flavipsychrobacter sp.]